KETEKALAVFEQLPPYRRKEIVRYIASLKAEESVERNVLKVIQHLLGKARFAGRD
ncbi:MAG TPA: YdeI/OmpD-associated family protein, partial [Bacteroidia bacterium]|nr:YdeI/OmpD-associated family protein [Bacteroidia bacterium]